MSLGARVKAEIERILSDAQEKYEKAKAALYGVNGKPILNRCKSLRSYCQE